jgi:hypothetical protein
MMLKLVVTICALALVAESVPAFAAKQEINQTIVRVEGGFPYKIKKSGSYKLTSNLEVPAGKDAIEVLADDVTIDLNGFGIIGPVVCSGFPTVCPSATTGVGIKAIVGADGSPGPAAVKVMNGFVRGMGSHGIFLQGDGSLVSKVTSRSNAGTGMIVDGMVSESSAIANGSTGMLVVIVSSSEATSNVGDGIILDGRGGVALNVLAADNLGDGIVPENGSVTGSTSNLNKGVGIKATCPSAMLNNTVVANGSSITTDRPGCVLENNGTRP